MARIRCGFAALLSALAAAAALALAGPPWNNGRMSIRLAFLLCLCGLWAPWAQAQLPARDLTVELRQIEDRQDEGSSYRAGPSEGTQALAPQRIQVRNGQKAQLRMHLSVPMQWVEAAQAASANSGAGVKQALQWFDVGQSVTVTPRWSGGNRAATVELEVQQADLATRSNADMPSQSRSQFSSTVTAPLAQWVTIAATGPAPARQGSYSSAGSSEVRRLLQIRVLVP
jgi:Bacterial type II and III secretion system protein